MKNFIFKLSSEKIIFSMIAVTLFSGIPQSAYAEKNEVQVTMQTATIKGTVVDVNGEPVIGATIQIKGTTTGIISDMDGNFTLNNASKNATLVVSFIGYKTQEIPLNGKTSVKVVLQEDSEVLDEVVVVGYGSMRKRDLTGSVIQIRPDKLANEAPKTVQDVLRGTPGLNVGMDASAKGGGTLQIRGQRSVYVTDKDNPANDTHNSPLIILDGMQFYGELSEINPDDIGQIDVLKDASAAAVYGAKAANGVIIISTKKGKTGKPMINVSTDWSFVTMGANRKVYGPEGYMNYRRDWYVANTYGTNPHTGVYEAYGAATWVPKKGGNEGEGEWVFKTPAGYYDNPNNLDKYGITLDQWRAYTGASAEMSDSEVWGLRLEMQGNNLSNYMAGKTFDWYDHSFRTGLNQNYNFSLSGATDRVNYYLSFGYMNNEGVAKGNDYTTFRSNMKIDAKVTKWLEVGANVNFQERTDGDTTVDWASQITRNSPFAQYRDEEGNLERFPMGNVAGESGFNHDYKQQFKEREAGYTVLNTIFNAKLNLPFGITYAFNISPRYQWYYGRTSQSGDEPGVETGSATRSNNKRFDWSLNNTLTWDKTIADKHRFTVTLVQEAEERRYWSDKINANKLLPTDALGFHYVGVADKLASSFSSDDSHETADGMLGRLFYSYDDCYMFTGSVRRDGYSAFGTSNPRATFFSTAFGWTFTNEKFFNWKPMSYGKLRFSWGENGNRQLADANIALANLGFGAGKTYGYINSVGNLVEYKYMSMSRLANVNLKWEKTTSWNIGLDFGFLNDRITGSLEYYHMPTTQMIMNQSIPQFAGFSSITSNLGEVLNRGFEISLNTTNIKNNVLEWNTTVGFSFNKNEIKHLYYEYEDVLDAQGNVIGSKESDDISNKWFIGKPIGTIWDYKVTGIWQKDEVEEAAKYGQRPGDPKVWNNPANDKVNADGTTTIVYDNDDKQFLGQTTPKVNWSLRNDFRILKDIGFSFNIYSKMGHKSTETYYLNRDNSANKITNGQNVYIKEYWTPDNPTNKYGRLDAQGPAGVTSPSMVRNRSFIRLESITLSYSLPKKIISRWGIEKLTLSGSVKNVAVWAKDWDYWDPETGGLAPRTFNLGLKLTL